jgi:cytochrome c5
MRIAWLTGILALASALWGASPPQNNHRTGTPGVHASVEADNMRVEGERRFQANCSRCHAAPHKFPPRMMATIVRHMRVRATLTDQDMKRVLFYRTQ